MPWPAVTPLPFIAASTLEPLATEAPLAATPEPIDGATPEPAVNPTDQPAELVVKITSHTASVNRNSTASVTIKTAARPMCLIVVTYNSGPSSAAGLGDKAASTTGVVSWSWKVGGRTSTGTYPIDITCALGDRTGIVGTVFTVK